MTPDMGELTSRLRDLRVARTALLKRLDGLPERLRHSAPEGSWTPAEILEHTGWLRSLARQLVRDPHTADDVVQTTLMAALEWEGTPRSGLRNWLTGVARNTAHQIHRGDSRRQRRHARAAAPEALPSAGEMVELVDSQRALAAAVLELEEPYRSTIFLRFYQDLQPKDIAERAVLPVERMLALG